MRWLRMLERHSGLSLAVLLMVLGAVLAGMVIQGCAATQPVDSRPGATPAVTPAVQGAAGGYALNVTEGGNIVARFSLNEIESLPSLKLTADGKEQEGPTVLSVLKRAGITNFTRITVVGLQRGRSHSALLPLDRAKVTDRVILSVNKRGKTKLVSPDIPSELWIVDVSELEVDK